MLVLVGYFERQVADVSAGLGHDAAGEVVEEVGLATVGLAGDDDEPALVGRVEDAVGERSVAYAVAAVVLALQHLEHLVGAFGHGD